MKKKKFLALFLAAAMMSGVLGACGDSSSDSGVSSGSTAVSSDGTASETQAVSGGEITVGIAQDLDDSLDPYQMTAAGTREVLFNVYEGLVKPDSDGNFVPAVASDYTVSDDQLTYTFTLRDGVKFHNGDTVTTDDVLYSFETCAATTVNDSLAAALSNVASVEAPDDHTVVITLSAASVDFLSYVSSVYIEPDDYQDQATSPVGTGPFKFVSRAVQQNIVLEKNEDYYGTPAYLDRVTFQIFEDATAEVTALDAGSIDMAVHLGVDQITNLSDDYNVLEGSMNLVQALYLNNAVEPFDDMKVRQALCYAVNVDEIMEITENGHGTRVGSAMYPAFTKYFDESLSDTYSYDPDKAKELLSEAGYADGFTFTIKVPSNYTPHVNTAEVIAEQLAQVGITAEIEQIDWNTWLNDVYLGRNYEATVIGFDAGTLTASAMLERYTSTADKNMFNYSNEEYDATYAEAVACTDDAEATELYKKCEKILADTAAAVYLQDLAEFTVIRSNLDGYQFYPLYVMDMSTVHYVE